MRVQLRPFARDELDVLQRFAVEPDAVGEFNWAGFGSPNAVIERFEDNGLLGDDLSELAVVENGEAVGAVQWLDPGYPGVPRGACWRFGCTLLPEARGRGLGTHAHQLLVDHLFSTTPAVRLEADTDVDNLAERRCLEKVGFTREGVLRSVGFRAGRWRDVARYGLLRDDG